MTSYFSENEAENLKNGDGHLAQIAEFGIRALWRIEVSDGSFLQYSGSFCCVLLLLFCHAKPQLS